MKYHLVASRSIGRTQPVISQLLRPEQSQSLLTILLRARSISLREPLSNTVTVLLKGFPHIVTVPSMSIYSRGMPNPKIPCEIHQSFHVPIFLSSNKELRGGRRRTYLSHCARSSTPPGLGYSLHRPRSLPVLNLIKIYLSSLERPFMWLDLEGPFLYCMCPSFRSHSNHSLVRRSLALLTWHDLKNPKFPHLPGFKLFHTDCCAHRSPVSFPVTYLWAGTHFRHTFLNRLKTGTMISQRPAITSLGRILLIHLNAGTESENNYTALR